MQRPDITFSDRYLLALGGSTMELIYAKGRHTDHLNDIYFPDERVLFLRRTGGPVTSAAASHSIADCSPTGSPRCAPSRRWTSAVTDAVDQGLTLREMQETIRLEGFEHVIGHSGKAPFATPRSPLPWLLLIG